MPVLPRTPPEEIRKGTRAPEMGMSGLRQDLLRQNAYYPLLVQAEALPDAKACLHALGRHHAETGRKPGTCIPADRASVEAEDAENVGKRWKHGTFRNGLGGSRLHKRADVRTERQEKAGTVQTPPPGRSRHRLPRPCASPARKLGTGWHRGFQGCVPRPYSARLRRLSRHGALRRLLSRMQRDGGELEGQGSLRASQSGQPPVRTGQAEVCRAPADPPQERSLVAGREGVPEGKDGEHGIREIPVVLL